MLYAFSNILIVTLQVFQAAISKDLQQYQRCYNLHDDFRLRSHDYSTEGLTDVTVCLTLKHVYTMIQWLPNKCLESDSIKETISFKRVLTLVRVGNKACPGYMSLPRQGSLGASCTKLIGTYAKEECRDLCYLLKSCRAVTYRDADQTCRVCVQFLGSFKADNTIGYTSYIRLTRDVNDTSPSQTIGAWFRKNDLSGGESGIERDRLEHKLVNLLSCAIRCLQEGNCAGFSISLNAGSLHCDMRAGGDSLFLKVSPHTLW